MNIERFEELENRIEEKSYTKAYAGKAKLWYLAGLFFQALNIGICFLGLYWFLGKLFPVFPGDRVVFGIISVTLLVFWEFLKRSTVQEVTTNRLREHQFASKHFGGLLLAVFLVGGSGYLAIRGASEIADTSTLVEAVADTNLTAVRDSVEAQYDKRVLALEAQSQAYAALAAEKGRPMNRREAQQVQQWTQQGQELRKERDTKLTDLQKRTEATVTRQKRDIHGNSLAFLLMTLGIESIILFCVIYGAKFDYSSFEELSGDDRFRQFRLHIFLLNLVYQNGRQKEGSDCMPMTRLEELVKIKRGNSISAADIIGTQGADTPEAYAQFLKDHPKARAAFQENFN